MLSAVPIIVVLGYAGWDNGTDPLQTASLTKEQAMYNGGKKAAIMLTIYAVVAVLSVVILYWIN